MARKRHLLFHKGQPLLKTGLKYLLLGVLGFALALGWQPATAHHEPHLADTNNEVQLLAQEIAPLFKGGWGDRTENTAPLPKGGWGDLIAQSNTNDGRYFYKQGRFAEAAQSWRQALADFPGNPLDEALTRNYLSLAYQQLGQWEDARDEIEKSRGLLDSVTDGAGGSKKSKIYARALSTQGRLLLAVGETDNVLGIFARSAEIYEELGDEEGAIGSKINQAQAMQALGRYRQALKKLAEIRGDLENQPNELKAAGLRNLGNAYQAVGDLERSWCALQDSRQVSQSPQAVSSALLSLGNTARAFGERVKSQGPPESLAVPEDCKNPPENLGAKGFYQQAEEFYGQVANTENAPKSIQLRAGLNYLNLLVAKAKDEFTEAEAQQYLQGSRQTIEKLAAPRQYLQSSGRAIDRLITQLSPSRRAVYARINLAQSLEALGVSGAKGELEKADRQARQLKDKRSLSYARGYLGNFYERNQQRSKATELTQEALTEARGIYAPDLLYQWQWQLGRILKAEGKNREAISEYEGAVETLQAFRRALVNIGLDLDEPSSSIQINSDIQFNFQERVEPVYSGYADLLLQAGGEENVKKALTAIELLHVSELETYLQCALQNRDRQVEAVSRAESLEKAREIVESNLTKIHDADETAAVIYPIVLKDRVEVILSLPGKSLRHYSYNDIDEITAKKTVDRIQFLLRKRAGSGVETSKLSEQVYQWLIAPIENELNGVETLVFGLDSVLRNIPMSILYDGEEYLIEKYGIAVIPRLEIQGAGEQLSPNPEVLAAGLSKKQEGFQALPFVEVELDNIKEILPATQELRDEAFTGDDLEREVQSRPFPVIHLATHGKFSSQPDQTFVLANGPERIRSDRLAELLDSRREANPDDPIQLLVFSACQTAEGDRRAVLGLAGVAVDADVRSTIGSLWPVNDRATADFMGEFYKELQQRKTRAEALREVQQHFLTRTNDTEWRNPHYWAPFVLVGNWW